jgi:hypothetical protein
MSKNKSLPPHAAFRVIFRQDAALSRHWGGNETGRRNFKAHLELLCITHLTDGIPELLGEIDRAVATLYPGRTYRYAFGMMRLIERVNNHLIDLSMAASGPGAADNQTDE